MTFQADRNAHSLVIGGGIGHLCRSRLREVPKDLLPAEKPWPSTEDPGFG
jgi:hypothetical protein